MVLFVNPGTDTGSDIDSIVAGVKVEMASADIEGSYRGTYSYETDYGEHSDSFYLAIKKSDESSNTYIVRWYNYYTSVYEDAYFSGQVVGGRFETEKAWTTWCLGIEEEFAKSTISLVFSAAGDIISGQMTIVYASSNGNGITEYDFTIYSMSKYNDPLARSW